MPCHAALFDHIDKVAPTESTVLVLGETGTGKELVACSVHQQSLRADKTMISVNCAAIPETLIESELFGYEKGAFTGANTSRMGLIEAADGGTLFLDEIGELPMEAQARLLRFIQEGEIRRIGSVHSRKVDVRLICATHRNLQNFPQRACSARTCIYRINVLRLSLPPCGNAARTSCTWPRTCCRPDRAPGPGDHDPVPAGDPGYHHLPVAGQCPRAGARHRAGGDTVGRR